MQSAHAAAEAAEAQGINSELASLHQEIRELRAELSARSGLDSSRRGAPAP
jgi:hypothetical protein